MKNYINFNKIVSIKDYFKYFKMKDILIRLC